MYQIQKTKDYKKFKKMAGNRTVTKTHIENLKKSIREDNQLNLHPIVVNENWEVIDGQTRLIAAEELGEPIYYIKSDDVKDIHFVLGNINQKKLSIKDYIKFYAVNKKIPEFIELDRVMRSFNLSAKSFLSLYAGSVKKHTIEKLREGIFDIPKSAITHKALELYLVFIDYVKERRIKPFHMFQSATFVQAFRWLTLTTDFDMKVFLLKLENRWTELKPQSGSNQWYKLLIEIYNWKNQKRIDLEFIDE